MSPRRPLWLASLSLVVAAWIAGCVSTTDSSTEPANCVARCRAYATTCMNDVAQCDSLCPHLTETQLSCLEQAMCDHAKVSACLPTTEGAGGSAGSSAGGASAGGSSAGGASAGSGGSDSQGAGGMLPMCLGDGEPGCTNAAAGPNCCAPGVCDPNRKACCTTNPNAPCTKDSDCCGAGLGTVHCIAGEGAGKVCVVNQ